MLCSICNKNTAVVSVILGVYYQIFADKVVDEGAVNTITNVIENTSNVESPDELGEDFENSDSPNAVPLGSIFSNIFGMKNNDGTSSSTSSGSQKVKVDKKAKDKKRKALDTFGTNLTVKAKSNELDAVIGRNKEIQRVIQILNRRSKNNPCLIGEPGVGKIG